jgi:FHA domain
MTETGLIIAEVVFLVLLYAFVWAIVRSASRQLTGSPAPPPPPPAAPEPPPAQREPAMAAAPAAPAAPEPAVAPLPPPVDIPAPPPVPAAASDRSEDMTEAADQGSGPLDLSANLDPRLVVEASPSLAQGREIPLAGGITIGRSEAADVTISDQFVSHMHARVTRRGAYHFVVDLGSTNGTFLNDRRIESDAQLKVRDTLRIGQSILRYEE